MNTGLNIKDLINELNDGDITLRHALTRSLLVAHDIHSEVFEKWIRYELNGYPESEEVPAHRRISSELHAVIEAFGIKKMYPISFDELDDDLNGLLSKFHCAESIWELEEIFSRNMDPFYYAEVPEVLQLMMQKIMDNKMYTQIKRKVSFMDIMNVLSKTKKVLLDILIDIEASLPILSSREKYDWDENRLHTRGIVERQVYKVQACG